MSLPRDRHRTEAAEEKHIIERNNALMREYVRFLLQVEQKARVPQQPRPRASMR